jgi:hypothetical protein
MRMEVLGAISLNVGSRARFGSVVAFDVSPEVRRSGYSPITLNLSVQAWSRQRLSSVAARAR